MKLFYLLGVVVLCFVSVSANELEGFLAIDGEASIARIDHDFICATLDWWPPEKCDYGTCAWGKASLLNLDLDNTVLLNAVKAFAPLKIRLGGTLQDKVTYSTNQQPCPHFVKNTSAMFGFTPGCLPMSRWDQLNNFFNKSGAVIIFGLNALNGRTIASDGSAVGPWDSSNAASFIRYTVDKGYNIYAWELGNELSGSGVGTRVAAAQYASDVIKLDSLVNDIYAGSNVKPQIIAPGGFFAADWYKELVDKTPNSLDIVTHHIYNLGPGVDTHLVEKILDPGYLDGMIATFRDVRDLVKDTGAAAWVGEAGGAYNSGHNLVTNAFVFSFWYLDQLGMSSKYNTKTYCRQTLIGGNYGLLNTTTLLPNPDYYSALLWNQLMGTNVLFANFTGTNKIRAYSHCAKQSKGIVLLLINLDGNTTVQVHLTTTPNTITRAWRHHRHHKHSRFARTIHGAAATGGNSREEYHLTAMNGDLHSQTMLLNGKILAVNLSGDIPPLEPTSVNSSDPIRVAPYSIVFVHIPSIQLPACA
ncbi:heparanase [Ranunculus cassubicifolius]